MKLSLSKGAKINNGIRKNKPSENFNLNFIDNLFTLGAKMCLSGNDNNILIVIIKQYREYSRNAIKTISDENFINLLRLVIEKEEFIFTLNVSIELMEPNNIGIIPLIITASPKLQPKILSKAINLNKPLVVKRIFEHGFFPEEKHLELAISLNKPQIVKIIFESGFLPNVHHLKLAINTMRMIHCDGKGLLEGFSQPTPMVTSVWGNSTARTDDVIKKCSEIINLICKNGAISNPLNTTDPHLSEILTNILTDGVRTGDIEIVRLLCEQGAKLNQSQTCNNTLSCAVKTKNCQIIVRMCKHGALPDLSQTSNNTLSLAVETQSLKIVEMICKSGGLPDVSMSADNTLYLAALTMNPMIISLVIRRGGVPTDGVNYREYNKNGGVFNYHENIFHEMTNHKHKQRDEDEFNHVIRLLLCAGAKINHKTLECDDTLCPYFYLLNRLSFSNNKKERGKKERLKRELAITMNDLEEDYIDSELYIPVPKETREQIDSAMNKVIPVPCIEIICGYLSPIRFIDWTEF